MVPGRLDALSGCGRLGTGAEKSAGREDRGKARADLARHDGSGLRETPEWALDVAYATHNHSGPGGVTSRFGHFSRTRKSSSTMSGSTTCRWRTNWSPWPATPLPLQTGTFSGVGTGGNGERDVAAWRRRLDARAFHRFRSADAQIHVNILAFAAEEAVRTNGVQLAHHRPAALHAAPPWFFSRSTWPGFSTPAGMATSNAPLRPGNAPPR